MVHDLQDLRLLQPRHGLGLFVMVHQDHLLAPGTQQMIPGQRTDYMLILIQNGVGAEAALQHPVLHIVDIVVQMEID